MKKICFYLAIVMMFSILPTKSFASSEVLIKGVPIIAQKYNELPNGCEPTALTMLLNFYGVDVNKFQVAEALPQGPAPYTKNGKLYAADPQKEFIGNPADHNSYGIYYKPILKAIESYLPGRSIDLSLGTFENLLTYIDNGQPVMVWATMSDGGKLLPIVRTTVWNIENSTTKFQWLSPEHALVLIGYTSDKKTVILNDPLTGKQMRFDYETFKNRWIGMGKQAVAITEEVIQQPIQVKTETTAKIGDYIQFGNYNGQTILWRVIDLDAAGDPLLLSEKILSIQAFDLEDWDGDFKDDTPDDDINNNFVSENNFSEVEKDAIKPETKSMLTDEQSVVDNNLTDSLEGGIEGVVENSVSNSFPVGVRPACYIYLGAINFTAGTGTLESPYLANAITLDDQAVPIASEVLVNNTTTTFDAYTINGENFFKLRDLALVVSDTNKHFDVSWDGAAINLTSNMPYTIVGGEMVLDDNKNVTIYFNNSMIYIDDIESILTAYTIKGNTYFKLRDIGQVFDIGVTWEGSTKTIFVDTDISYVQP